MGGGWSTFGDGKGDAVMFPPSRGKEAVEDVTPELGGQINVVNYKSFVDHRSGAAGRGKLREGDQQATGSRKIRGRHCQSDSLVGEAER